VAWRQLTTALRSRGPLVLVFVFAVALAGPLMASLAAPDRTDRNALPIGMAGMAMMMTIFMTALVAYDFRGDLDRMDVLKSLPIRPVPVAVGQLLAPVLVVTALQWLGVLAVAVTEGQFTVAFAGVMALAVPFNFFLFGLENLLFLLFPTRIVVATPGDVQVLGRNLLLLFLKMVILMMAGGLGAGVAFAVYYLAGENLAAALGAAWLVLAGFAAATVPLVALAFRRYDVARDTPP
jgi:hypothetical protein